MRQKARLCESERYAERARRVRALEPDPVRARRHAFFLDVDLETSDALEDVPEAERRRLGLTRERWERSLAGAAQLAGGPAGPGLLKQRLEERARVAARCEPVPLDVSGAVRDSVKHLSNVLLGSVERHLAPLGDPGLADEVAEAFEAFAAGELLERMECDGQSFRLGGEPDSAFFFFWAEFADLCVELGISEGIWGRLLGPLVAAQELFLKAYAPRARFDGDGQPIRAHFVDFSPGNADREAAGGLPSRAERLATRDAHAKLDRAQLLDLIGRRAQADLGLG